MGYSEVASRYATALYQMTVESKNQDEVFQGLREFDEIVSRDPVVSAFIRSPLVKAEQKETVFREALEDQKLSENLKNFILLLARKNRIDLFPEIVEAFQDQTDAAHGVTRGIVRSASVLGPESRKKIEEIVSRVTQKQVILNYKEDPNVIGGLIAHVGSYTFDDTLSSHLRRIKEDLDRRVH